MQINPYLMFNGDCAEAFKLYERVLGGKIVGRMTHGESPVAGHRLPGWEDKILHIRLVAGDAILMGSDSPPEYYAKPEGVHVSLQVEDPARAERIFQELSKNGTVTMAIEKTFWAERFGMLIDRFGIPWMVNCELAGDASSSERTTRDLARAR